MTWKCPKCGREFSRQNQDHYCVKPQNIDDHIAAQDEKYQPLLREVRAVLRNALPEVEERISLSLITRMMGDCLPIPVGAYVPASTMAFSFMSEPSPPRTGYSSSLHA